MKLLSTPYYLIVVLFFLSQNLDAQKLHYELPENASKLYNMGNYYKALELYRSLYKKDLTNTKNAYHYGVCLIYTHHYKDGLKILESTAKKSGCPSDVTLHLGKAYHYTLRFDMARSHYQKYLETNSPDEKTKNWVNRLLEMCDNAELLVKQPVNVSFENLGDRVNSPGKDFFPIITDDESILHFSTRREGTTGRVYDLKGYYTADVYIAKYKYEKWSKPRSIGTPNSYGNEFIAGASEDGKNIFYYVNNPQSKNNLQHATKGRSSFKRAEKIESKDINLKTSIQNGATISDDGNTLIFSSDRNASSGFDLFICRKLPNEKWSKATPLSDVINTKYNDNYPYLTNDGNTLYFASEGHNSMGGYDLFVTNYNTTTETWSKPENLGYPINSPHDDYNICFTENKKYAYLAANRKDSYGNYDIYRISYDDETPPLTTIKGLMLNPDTSICSERIHMEVFNHKTGVLEGIYDSSENGKYLMILAPGKYELIAEVPGYGTYKEVFSIAGRKNFKSMVSKNIQLNFEAENVADDNP